MIEFRFPKFPTHVPITKNKKAPDKFVKVNGQGIYNGAIARFGRSVAVKNLHRFFLRHIPEGIQAATFPVKIKYIFKSVINHGDISRRKGEICWKYPKEGYVPTWDIENATSIWVKTGNDSLAISKVIPDDSIEYVNAVEYEFQPVEDLDDREIIIQIYSNNGIRTDL